MIIAADGPVNNMSHNKKTERTSDFLLWYSSIEDLANDWETPNSSVLKSFFKKVNRKPIDNTNTAQLQDILTSFLILSDFSHIFLGCSKHFAWFCGRLVFHILWVKNSKILWTEIHFHEQSFQCFVNTFRIGNVKITYLNKILWLKMITAEIRKDPSYIRCELLLKYRCIFMVVKHCLRFRRPIDSFLKFT